MVKQSILPITILFAISILTISIIIFSPNLTPTFIFLCFGYHFRLQFPKPPWTWSGAMDHNKLEAAGYGKPPWIFKGSALYQLHLVKAETARALIPKEFRLVEAFGYTLGGFFLASYDDSPAASFDELVVIAGIVWNPPTSCAWAARVLVNSNEACIHGRKDVGLPSRVARFSKTIRAIPRKPKSKIGAFLDTFGVFDSDSLKSSMEVQVTEMKGLSAVNLCNIRLSTAGQSSRWMDPNINMSLPSFSGRTKYNSELLKYSCDINCRVRAVAPAKVFGPPPLTDTDLDEEKSLGKKRSLCISVLLSKPIIALEFTCLNMKVEAPTVASSPSNNPLRH